MRKSEEGAGQGLTLVPISAQLERFRPPYNPTDLMNAPGVTQLEL